MEVRFVPFDLMTSTAPATRQSTNRARRTSFRTGVPPRGASHVSMRTVISLSRQWALLRSPVDKAHLFSSGCSARLITVVLVDRRHRAYPIRADIVGMTLSTTMQEHISVALGRKDAVYLS